MDVPNQQIEWIDQYLDDQLNEAGKQQFTEKLESDPAFAESVRLHLASRLAIRQAGAQALKLSLHDRFATLDLDALASELDATPAPASVRPLYSRPLVWAVAASIVMLVLVIWNNRASTPVDMQQLYAEHITTPDFSQVRGETVDSLLLWETLIQYMQAGNYQQVIGTLDTLSPESSPLARYGDEVYLLKAIAHLKNQQLEEAEAVYIAIPKQS